MNINSNIGGMLTNAGARQGKQLGGAFTGLTESLLKPLDDYTARKKQQGAAKEVQDFLAANKDDPAALNAEAARYASMGNDAVAKVFTDAAQRAVDSKAKAARTSALSGTIEAMSAQDPQKMLARAAELAKIPGMEKEALALVKSAQDVQAAQAEAARVTALQTQGAALADKMGFPELAREIRTTKDPDRLQALTDKLTDKQMESAPVLTPVARRKVLIGVGYPPEQAAKIVSTNPSKDEFEAYRDLQKGDVEMYLDSSGQPVTYRTTEYGMVVVDGELKDPATLNLTEAPNTQVVKNVTDGMATEISKLGAKQFTELYGQAQKSREGIISIDNVVGDIDTMFTGTTANVELGVKKFLNDIGISVDPEGVMATEVYMAESAKRVAEYITNLGAGTGLSDKDLEFTRKVVAGDVTLEADTIKKMLKEYRAAAARKIEGYQQVRSRVNKSLGESNASALDFYSPLTVPQTSTTTSSDFDDLWGS